MATDTARPATADTVNGPQAGALGGATSKPNTPIAPATQAEQPVKKSSWRDFLPVHPAADLFPMMNDDELMKLAEDIRANGLRNLCCLIEDEHGEAVLIDGRNRLDAIELIGEEIALDNYKIFERWPANHFNVTERIISLNIRRRHLVGDDKDKIAAALLKEMPQRSDRAIATEVKRDHKTIAKLRKKMERSGEIPHVEKRADTKGRMQPSAKVLNLADRRKAVKPKAEPKAKISAADERKELERKAAQLDRDNTQKFFEIVRLREENKELRAGKTAASPQVKAPDPRVQECILEDADTHGFVRTVTTLAERYDKQPDYDFLFATLRFEIDRIEREERPAEEPSPRPPEDRLSDAV